MESTDQNFIPGEWYHLNINTNIVRYYGSTIMPGGLMTDGFISKSDYEISILVPRYTKFLLPKEVATRDFVINSLMKLNKTHEEATAIYESTRSKVHKENTHSNAMLILTLKN